MLLPPFGYLRRVKVSRLTPNIPVGPGAACARTGVAIGPFSTEVVSVLQSLYRRGMTGCGKNHSDSLEAAMRSTGLDLEQVKVKW